MSKVLGHFGTSAPGCLQGQDITALVPQCQGALVPNKSPIPDP
jgi:hypothetical protein